MTSLSQHTRSKQDIALVVTSYPGQPTVETLRKEAAEDKRPRKDYVVLQEILGAEVIDFHHMQNRGHWHNRLLARHVDMAAGQVLEVFQNRHRYRHILAWSDRLGLPLATLLKASGESHDLTMVSTWASRGRKAAFLKYLHVHTHLRALCVRRQQADIMAGRLHVPRAKLKIEPRGVDDVFWRPSGPAKPGKLCSVGWEARDYRTLIEAVTGLPIEVELAVGAIAKPLLGATLGPVARSMREIAGDGLPHNVTLSQRNPQELRELYRQSGFVVVAVKDVEFDAGVTAATEAMAMGRALIATQTPGIADLFTHGVEGIYVPPGDVRALREAIVHLHRNPQEAARMGANARRLVERNHRFDPCMQRLAAIVTGEVGQRIAA